MKKLFTFLFIAGAVAGFAQPGIVWQNTIGGSANDYLSFTQQTLDGGYVIGGYSESNISGDKAENSQGSFDYWVVKTDAAGAIAWQNTIGGSDSEELGSIQQTGDGGYVLGGFSYSNISGDKTENSLGAADYWVIKLDAAGGIVWQNTIGGSGDDLLASIAQTADGGYVLGGYSNSGISGDKTENSQGSYDYWVVKLDASGNISWQNTIGGSDYDWLTSIQQTSDNGYFLGGHSFSGMSGDKTETSQGVWDYWVIKLDAAGNISWQNTIGGSSTDQLYSIRQTADGGYVLGGGSDSNISGDKTENSQGASDYWVIKLDASGNISWQNTIGGDSGDVLYSIRQAGDGGYLLGGYSQSGISGDKTESYVTSEDYWVIKLNASGSITWQNTIGGYGNDILKSALQTSDGGFVLGGYSNSPLGADKTEENAGGRDYWVVKLFAECLNDAGLSNIQCNDNGTPNDGTDDRITFQLNPTGINLGSTYNVSVSSGSVTPASANYGSATTFTMNAGSASAGNVTVTVTDVSNSNCTTSALVTSPGICSGAVSATASAGTPSAFYSTLKGAFDAINAGTQQGAIVINIGASTTETATASLNASGSGASNYSSVLVQPTSAVTVSGNFAGAVVKLNGADNVTIDGRIGGTGRNLTIQNLYSGSLSAAVWLSSSGANAGCTGNTIRNCELKCGAPQNTAPAATYGIYMGGTTLFNGGQDNDNNQFIDNRITRVYVGISTAAALAANPNQNTVISGNIIGPSSFGADQIGVAGIEMTGENGCVIEGNTVQFVGGAFGETQTGEDRTGISLRHTSAIWGAGIPVWRITNCTVTKNVVHDVVNERTGSALGIAASTENGSSNTSNVIFNNMIYNVRANGANGEGAQAVGIGLNGGKNDMVAFNSVYLTGDLDPSGTESATGSAAGIRIYSTSVSNPTLKNNAVHVNLTSNTASLKHYALMADGGLTWGAANNSNHNNYYVNPANPQMALFATGTSATSTTPIGTLAAWQSTFSPAQDANSVVGNPQFNSATDLHINPALPSTVESAGTPIGGITTDIDGNARNASTPDIGADEGNFTPPIAMTFVSATTSQNNTSTVTASTANNEVIGIQVLTSGSYSPLAITNFAISTNGTTNTANIANARIFSTGISPIFATTSQFGSTVASPGASFNVGGSLALAEGTNYFWLTYDVLPGATAGNLIDAECNSLTVGSAQTPATQVPAGSRSILGSLNGIYTVGTGGNFSTLTAAASAVNTLGLSGNTIFNIISNTTETAASFNQWTEYGGSGYTLTIKPGGGSRVVSGSVSTALINLNGADRVSIDGQNNLTLRNTNTSGATIRFISDASNNTILNTIIEGNNTSTTSGVVFFSTGTTTGNDNNNITGCTIRDRSDAAGVPAILIRSNGSSAAITNTSNTISNCQLFNFTSTGIQTTTIGNESWTISGNTIYQVSTRATALLGINFSSLGANLITQNVIRNLNTSSSVYGIYLGNAQSTTVSRNRIYNFASTSGNTNFIEGIHFDGDPGGVSSVTIVNNQVSIAPVNTNNQVIRGIVDFSWAGNTCNILYNSVFIGGTGTGASSTWAIVRINLVPSVCIVKNNIAFNARTGGTGNHFAGGDQSAGTGTFTVGYNFWVGRGSTAANMMDRGTSGTGTPISFATWKTAANDLTSMSLTSAQITAASLFTSTGTGNLNILTNNPQCWYLNGKGVQLPGITEDYGSASAMRSTAAANGAPDIGADEFVPGGSILPPVISLAPATGINDIMIAGRLVARLTFGAGGTLPSNLNAYYYTDKTPDDPTNNGQSGVSAADFIKSYLQINPTGGSGYTYDMIYYYDDALLGSVSESNPNFKLAKKQTSMNGTWERFPTIVDVTANTLTASSLTSFSEFSGSTANFTLPGVTITPGGATTFCSGGSVLLTASGGTSYLWSTNETTAAIIASASGTYLVTVTVASGAIGTLSQSVTVLPLPNAVITPGGATTFCDGSSVLLTASGGTSYLWSTSETTAGITASASGTYLVTVTGSNACTATTSQSVTELSPLNTWTGTGDGINWSDPVNWSNGVVPFSCQDVVIHAGSTVTVMAGFNATGKTLEVAVGAVFLVEPTATLVISN